MERLTRDGNAVKLIGKRGGKEQEVASGTYDAESDVITLSFPSRGGTYDFVRDGDDSEFYPRGKKPGRYTYRPPLALDDGWPVSTLDAADIDRAAMEKFVQSILDMPMDSQDAPQFHGVLIARHGKLVLEEYFHEQHRDKLHNTRSASKSLTALIVGAAMHAGVPLKLSSPVYQVMNGGTFPPDLEPQKRAMTLEHLLTMSAGYFCDDTERKCAGQRRRDVGAGGGARFLSLHDEGSAGDAAGRELRLLQRHAQSRPRHGRPRRERRPDVALRPPDRASR